MFNSLKTRGVQLSVQALRSRSLATAPASISSSIPTPTPTPTATASSTASSIPKPDLRPLKLNSNGSRDLYAIFKLHNMPYMVTRGDKVYLPFRLKGARVGDSLLLNYVTTLGSPEYTCKIDEGIPTDLYKLKASVVEITREPYYEVYRKKQRCRRLKTFPVEPYQTVLMINELKLT
ncbi:mitochondrial 54S ribosomal protein YmL49 [Scheffersomyces amazonensis]|uniref:mitochondrial 54S ribosomal protein YmL49 n=1 Tax=Scheffersomyces amazonensis TaxID=1078765 RepID=UPI00315D99FB